MPHPHPSPVAALWPFPERGEQDQPHRPEQLLAPGVRSVAACAVDRGWAGPVAPEALRLQLSPEGRASEPGGIGPGSGRLACRGAGGAVARLCRPERSRVLHSGAIHSAPTLARWTAGPCSRREAGGRVRPQGRCPLGVG